MRVGCDSPDDEGVEDEQSEQDPLREGSVEGGWRTTVPWPGGRECERGTSASTRSVTWAMKSHMRCGQSRVRNASG